MVRILTLMDNTNGPGDTVAEHGLSFLIERQGRSVLFDTGKTGAFIDNARRLGVDVGAADALVVSHGHYDHAGGVRALYEQTAFRGPLWTGGGFFDKKWSMDPEGPRYTGLDFDAAYIEEQSGRWMPLSASEGAGVLCGIIPGVFAVNGFSRIHSIEAPNPRFMVDRAGTRTVDDFTDEVCLVIPDEKGLAVVLGCAHPGLMNMLDSVQSLFKKPVCAVFGGSHLVGADGDRIDATIEYLQKNHCPLAALGHCTGAEGATVLANRLPAYRPLFVGAEFIV